MPLVSLLTDQWRMDTLPAEAQHQLVCATASGGPTVMLVDLPYGMFATLYHSHGAMDTLYHGRWALNQPGSKEGVGQK